MWRTFCIAAAVLLPATFAAGDSRNSARETDPDAPRFRVRLTDLDANTHEGTLEAFDQRTIRLRGARRIELARDEAIGLVNLSADRRRRPRGPTFLLANGDRWHVQWGELADERLTVRWTAYPDWQPLTVPLEVLRGVLAVRLHDPSSRLELERRVVDHQAEGDFALLANGDALLGELTSLTTDSLSLRTSAGEIQLPASSLRALGFDPRLVAFPKLPERYAIVKLTDGSWLTCVELRLDEAGRLAFRLPWGEKFAIPPDDVAEIRFFSPKVVSLASLNPSAYRPQPFLSVEWPWRADRNVLGGPLTIRGTRYVDGIGMHSAGRLTFRLDGGFRAFHATMGIDDSAAGRGSAVFAVEVDGRRVFAGRPLRGTDAAVSVGPIDLSGAETLTLVVEFADRADVLDHADWCHPVLIR